MNHWIDRRLIGALIALISLGCQANQLAHHTLSHNTIDVKTHGAVGDGKTMNTAAFQKALDAAAGAGGGEVVVPAGNFLIGSIVMGSNTTLRLDKDAILTGSPNPDDYPLMDVRWEGRFREGHRALIHAKDAKNIAIIGEGTINGDMQIGDLRDPRGPCIFEPIECKNVRLEGFKVNFRRMWAMHLTYCDNVHITGLTIRSVRNNGDGIDVDSCRNVRIDNCDIDAGDDAIALKSGRGMEGVRIARPTENVTITDCKLGSDFAGLAIGTEMSGGIRNVRFSGCTFTRGVNGIYIKSRTGRGGFIEDIRGDDLTCDGARTFLNIDLVTKGIQDSEPVPGIDAYPRAFNIHVQDVKLVRCDTLLTGTNIAPEKPLAFFSLMNVKGTAKRAIKLANMKDVELRDITINGFEGNFFTHENVTGYRINEIKTPEDTSSRRGRAPATNP